MPTENQPDLTSPENIASGQEVYARIMSGQCQDVKSELDAAYGINTGE